MRTIALLLLLSIGACAQTAVKLPVPPSPASAIVPHTDTFTGTALNLNSGVATVVLTANPIQGSPVLVLMHSGAGTSGSVVPIADNTDQMLHRTLAVTVPADVVDIEVLYFSRS